MFNVIKNTFKDFVTLVKDKNEIYIPKFGMYQLSTTNKLNVDNNAVRKYTGAPSSIPSAIAFRYPNVEGYAVIVNDGFLLLPSNLRDAIHLHELGHVYHDHLNDSRNSNGTYKSDLKDEIEADEFALKHNAALPELFNYLMIHHPFIISSDRYMVDRIKHLIDLGYDIDTKLYRYHKIVNKILTARIKR